MVPMYLNSMFIIYLHVYSSEMVISMEQRHINIYIYMYTYHFDAYMDVETYAYICTYIYIYNKF